MRDPLRAYVQSVQDDATRLDGLMDALDLLTIVETPDKVALENGMAALIQIGRELTRELHCALDSVNLPRERANEPE